MAIDDITFGVDRRNIFYQIRKEPVNADNDELNKREQLEENTSAHLVTLLADGEPEVSMGFLKLLSDSLGVGDINPNSEIDIRLEHDIQQNHPDETYLVGLANDPAEFSRDQLPTINDRGNVDLYLTVDSDSDVVGIGIEVKTGSGTLDSHQLGKYATGLDASAVGTISWSQVYDQLQQLAEQVEVEYELKHRTPYLLAHFLEYLEITGHHTRTQQRRAVQLRDRGQDEISVEYTEGDLEIVFKSETAYEEKSNQTHKRQLAPAEFDRLFSDIERRYGQDFISRVFVTPRANDSPHPHGAEAIAETVGDDNVIGEIPGITTNEDNYLRLFYKPGENEIWLREVQPAADGSSPNGFGSPAGGGEQHVWVVRHNEFNRLLSQDESEGFDEAFRRDLFLHRDFGAIRERFEMAD